MLGLKLIHIDKGVPPGVSILIWHSIDRHIHILVAGVNLWSLTESLSHLIQQAIHLKTTVSSVYIGGVIYSLPL